MAIMKLVSSEEEKLRKYISLVIIILLLFLAQLIADAMHVAGITIFAKMIFTITFFENIAVPKHAKHTTHVHAIDNPVDAAPAPTQSENAVLLDENLFKQK